MDAERGFEPTIQKCMYGAVIIGIAFLVVSQFERYHTVTKKIKVTLRSVGIVIIGLCTMYLFQKCNKYFSNEIPPQYQEGDCESTLSFVRWQKDRHKIERDMYLATVVPHWMDKYYTYIDYKNKENEEEKTQKKHK